MYYWGEPALCVCLIGASLGELHTSGTALHNVFVCVIGVSLGELHTSRTALHNMFV